MKIFLRSFTAQWKLFVRDKVNWLFSLLVLVVALVTNPISELPETTALGYIENIARIIGYIACLLFVILYLRYFLNETAKGHNHLWSRNVFGDDYLILKAGVGIAGFLTLISPTVCLTFILSVAFFGIANALNAIWVWVIILLPPVCFVISICSLIGLLINHILVASGVIIIYLGFVLTRPVDLGNLLIFMPTLQMNSALIGFGPETEMLIYQRLFYVCVALFLLMIAFLVTDLRLPRVKTKHSWNAVAAISILSLASLFLSVFWGKKLIDLQHLRSVEPNFQTRQNLRSVCSHFQSYRLYLELSADGAIASGLAEVELSPGRDISALSLLNTGLAVDRFEVRDGDPIRIELQYHGRFVVPYYAYSVYSLPKEIEQIGYAPGAYLETNLIFLQKLGEWHPYALCSPDEITLILPADITINYNSADIESIDGDMRRLQWQQASDHILLIAGAKYQIEEQEKDQIYLSPNPGLREEDRNEQYGTFFRLVWQNLYDAEGSGSTLIPLPLIKQSYWESEASTLIIPERSRQIDYIWPDDMAKYSENVAMDVLLSWWCREQHCPDLAYGLFSRGSDIDCSYEKSEEASGDKEDDTSSLPLLYYAALKLVEEAEVSGFDHEALLESYSLLLKNEATSIYSPFRFTPKNVETLIRLNNFDAQYGSEAFWDLLLKAFDKSNGGWIEGEVLLELIDTLPEQSDGVETGT